jgi:hypothetical protein
MRGKNLLLYILIVILNSFLFFSIIYSYGILAPLHVLINWLTFDRILSTKGFLCKWNKNIFALIPAIFQVCITFILFDSQEDDRTIKGLITFLSNILILILIIVTIIEFILLRSLYSSFQKK